VTNNNGFWIRRLNLLGPSFPITLNHNQLQELIINYCQGLAPLSFSRGGPIENTYVDQQWIYMKDIEKIILYCYIYSALHSSGSYPILAYVFVAAYCCRLYLTTGCLPRICPGGDVLIEPLPSSGSIRHITILCIIEIHFYQMTNFIVTTLKVIFRDYIII
jgi:hypothetical protein